jgi:hypothetical protein
LTGSGVGSGASSSVQFSPPLQTGDPVTVAVTCDLDLVTAAFVPAFTRPFRLAASSTFRYGPRHAVVP